MLKTFFPTSMQNAEEIFSSSRGPRPPPPCGVLFIELFSPSQWKSQPSWPPERCRIWIAGCPTPHNPFPRQPFSGAPPLKAPQVKCRVWGALFCLPPEECPPAQGFFATGLKLWQSGEAFLSSHHTPGLRGPAIPQLRALLSPPLRPLSWRWGPPSRWPPCWPTCPASPSLPSWCSPPWRSASSTASRCGPQTSWRCRPWGTPFPSTPSPCVEWVMVKVRTCLPWGRHAD